MVQTMTRRTLLKRIGAGTTALTLSGLWRPSALGQSALISVTNGAVDTMEVTRLNDPNLQLVANLFDGLLRRDPQGNLLPALATSFERPAADAWVFHLREGVKFHDGSPFGAEDVKFSLERLKEDFSEFSFFGSSIQRVEIENNLRVRVITDGPVPFFADNMHQTFIISARSAGRSLTDLATNPIGTGAYRFVAWEQGSFVDLEANAQYWGGAPAIQRVRHQEILDDSTRLAALESGEADLVQNLPGQFAQRVGANPGLRLVSRDGRQCIFFSPTVVDTPFAELKVRQAAYHAIDAQLIIDTALNGFGTLAAQIPDPSTIGYDAGIQRLPFDQERARQLLRDANLADGFDLTVDVLNDQFVNPEGVGQAVAQMLQQVGINAQVRSRPGSVFFEDAGKAFFIVGWFDGAYDFGRTAGNLLTTGSFFNGSQYANAQFDALIDQANATLDPTTRATILRQANRLVMDDVGLVPLHYEGQVWGTSNRINFIPRSDTWTVYADIIPSL